MPRRLIQWFLASCCAAVMATRADNAYREFRLPPHDYFGRAPADRFTRLKGDLESGRLALDRTSELTVLRDLLRHFGIPESSQMLLFSTTSLQLSRISPTNPRALYFTEDVYLGYIPGGRIEVAALDPDLGAVFYIFDLPRGDAAVSVERATRCMNCHAGEDTGHVPGLVVKSVLPGVSGGSLDAFRLGQSGHGVALAERFGGWYVTGEGNLTNHWGNALGRSVEGNLTRIPNRLEARGDPARYLRPTSDVLPQLVHEHQVGFVNRVVEAAYRARTCRATDGERLTAEHGRELDEQAEIVTRYVLFADEVPLPAGGIAGDAAFREDFRRNRRVVDGASLKDFDLRTRLFRYRCSYMVASPVFAGLPVEMKERVRARLEVALRDGPGAKGYEYLEAGEKRVIRRLLRDLWPDLPADWAENATGAR